MAPPSPPPISPDSARSAKKRLKLLEAKREALFLRLQNAYDLIKSLTTPTNIGIFRTRCLRLPETETEYYQVVEDINSTNIDLNEDYVVNFQSLSSFDDLYTHVNAKLAELCASDVAANEATATPAKGPVSKIKLPTFPIPTFSGKPQEWPLWYQSFKSLICDDASLSDIHKMYFLREALKDKAKSFISELPGVQENFSVVWEALKERYEDARILASSYVESLLQFKQPVKETASSLDAFLQSFVSPAKAFLSLQLPDHSDYLLFHLALSRLHPDTVRQFESSLSLSKNNSTDESDDKIPTFTQLVKFLREHAKILARQPVVKNQGSSLSYNYKKPLISNSNSSVRPSHSLVINKTSQTCSVCSKEPHALYYCQEFKRMKVHDRLSLVQKKNLCLNCLSAFHVTAKCQSKHKCSHCDLFHHSLIHTNNNNNKNKPSNNNNDNSDPSVSNVTVAEANKSAQNNNNSSVSCSSYDSSNAVGKTSVLLATAIILMTDSNQQTRQVRALIDSASQSNIITTECCNKLGLRKRKINTCIKGVGSVSNSVHYTTRFTFFSRLDKKHNFTIDALVMDEITGYLPTAPLNHDSFSHLEGLILADDNYHIPAKIDILLGASVFSSIINAGKICGPSNAPVALKSCLGYILMGSVPDVLPLTDSYTYCSFTEDKNSNLDNLVAKFWDLEDIPNSSPQTLSSHDNECENIFTSSVSRDADGRYSVTLPFQLSPSELGHSWYMARQCLLSLEKRLDEQPDIKKQYHSFIQDHIDLGHISRSYDDSDEGCFLPHHCVLKPDSPSTKLRVVWNASARTTSGLSLNDVLHTGPKLQTDLRSLLLRFRAFKIAVSADLKQMFLQILIKEEHKKFQKFLWRFSNDECISAYTLNTVTFGVKPSPYLAQRTVQQLATDSATTWPQAAASVKDNFYIDDYCTSFPTLKLATLAYSDLVAMFKSGGFDLVKWCSNSPILLNTIPDEMKMSTNHFDLDNDSTLKILGLRWTASSDFFVYDVSIPQTAETKREILSLLARIFDPLGFISPLTVYIKLLLHDLWITKVSWDDKLDLKSSLMKKWSIFLKQLPILKSIQIHRYLGLQPDICADLIGFCDASSKAYGAVIYVRTVLKNEVRITLLTSRTRVAKKNILTIPRLELCAAGLLAQLFIFVIDSFKSIFNFSTYYAFTDSSVTLYWILSSYSRWNSFVSNRVKQIQAVPFNLNWRHVAGSQNPADCLSRGLLPQELIKHNLWYTGPSWLTQEPAAWPQSKVLPSNDELIIEEKKHKVLISTDVSESNRLCIFRLLIDQYSEYDKLIRITSYILRLKSLHRDRSLTYNKFVYTSEFDKTEIRISKFIQKEYFSNEYNCIANNRLCSSSFQKLNPFIDPIDKVIRVGGRLSNSDLEYSYKHPILLPKNDRFVHLLIDFYHIYNFHTGPSLVLSLIRQKFWILGGRGLVRQRVHACNICFRARPKSTFPLMADLPKARVTQTKPFLHTGVDYAGPFFVTPYKKRGVRTQKVYICLFVCLCVKAIHLEVASDLSTQTFLNAFKRFISRRGPVKHMYSDCGTNFIGARAYLNDIYALTDSDDYNNILSTNLSKNRIEWVCNVPSAPHMGGVWESQVKCVKSHLLKLISGHTLTMEEFNTVLTQIEALLNSRPLGLLRSDPNDLAPLTPAHFLLQVPLSELPATAVQVKPMSYLSRYRLLDGLVQQFWRRWRVEYLHTLQTREKWNTPSNPIQIGTVVLVEKENIPPLQWPLGKVEAVHPGQDGIIRVATIRIGSTLYRRPVVKLCPLPTQ